MPSPAENYLASFPPDEQQKIRDSWGGQDRLQEWFDNAYRANAVDAQGNSTVGTGVTSPGSGHSLQSTADVTGMRAAAREAGMSEDFDRFDEETLQRWEQFRDPKCPPKFPYRQDKQHATQNRFSYQENACVEKPIDTGGVIQDQSGNWIQNPEGQPGQQGANPSSKMAKAPPPPKPTTFGGAGDITYTGNPLVDNLIYQFNTQRQLGDTGQNNLNIFGMRNERTADPSNVNNDPQNIKGQLLKGGGMWWTDANQAKDVFQGWRVGQQQQQKKKKKAGGGGGSVGYSTQPATTQPAPAPQPAQTKAPNVNPLNETPGYENANKNVKVPQYKSNLLEERKSGYGFNYR